MATARVFETQARNGDKIRNVAAIINCADVLTTLLWYQDQLGLQVEFAWGDPVIHGSIIAGDTTFHFSRSAPTGPRTSYMTIYVHELDELFDDIAARGVEVIQPPETMEWERAFMIHDCNGDLVMFADPSSGE